jgi:hypothetical protein
MHTKSKLKSTFAKVAADKDIYGRVAMIPLAWYMLSMFYTIYCGAEEIHRYRETTSKRNNTAFTVNEWPKKTLEEQKMLRAIDQKGASAQASNTALIFLIEAALAYLHLKGRKWDKEEKLRQKKSWQTRLKIQFEGIEDVIGAACATQDTLDTLTAAFRYNDMLPHKQAQRAAEVIERTTQQLKTLTITNEEGTPLPDIPFTRDVYDAKTGHLKQTLILISSGQGTKPALIQIPAADYLLYGRNQATQSPFRAMRIAVPEPATVPTEEDDSVPPPSVKTMSSARVLKV